VPYAPQQPAAPTASPVLSSTQPGQAANPY
jgi:hypothetical protein